MPHLDLICLANSYKHGGRCVAGLRTDGAGWIRPISSLPDGTLYPSDYMLSDYTEPGALDVIRVGLTVPRPAAHQPENWVIDGTTWGLIARPMPAALAAVLRAATTSGPDLLGGQSDRVIWAVLQQQPATASLALATPSTLDLYHQLSLSSRPQVRGRFALGPVGQPVLYDLVVTDPRWKNRVLAQGPQTLRQADKPFAVTISLSEPFGLHCYKLIAAICFLPP